MLLYKMRVVFKVVENMAVRAALTSVFFAAAAMSLTQANEDLSMSVTARADSSSSFPKISISWSTALTFASVIVSWSHCIYTDQQVACRELGRQTIPDPRSTSLLLTDAVKFDAQFLLTVKGIDACGHTTSTSAYVTVWKPSKDLLRFHDPLYLVLGPVTASNVTVEWGRALESSPLRGLSPPSSFRVSWRRVDGSVGHPGHDTTLVTSRHLIQGLLPATRYEVCVLELTQNTNGDFCVIVHTLEAEPGPPSADDAWCSTEAKGTHWRCDVTWLPPANPNGRIVRYTVQWRDSEGYVLHTAHPHGTLCSPICQSTAVLSFHPHEACVVASTAVGGGWGDCVCVHDARSRLLAVFERKLLYAVVGTLLLYILGPRLLGALLRCCVRGLARHVDDDKRHQV